MSKDRNNKKGFTLAEVLITLTIIGVVAALTIPSLLSNVSDKTYDAKRKGFATRMAQAVSQIGVLNAYEAKPPAGSTEDLVEYAEEHSTMNFIAEALSKVYKISNMCEFEKYEACDFPVMMASWYTSDGQRYTKNYPNLQSHNSAMTAENLGGLLTKAAAFKTKNGESVLLYYNPRCIPEQNVEEGGSKIWTKEVCLEMLVDLDGAKKGPNTFAKDIYSMTVMYPDTPYLIATTGWVHGNGANVPSYNPNMDELTPEEAKNANAELACENAFAHGQPVGSFTLASREENYSLNLIGQCQITNRKWTSSILGAGPDDYGWVVGPGAIATLEKRSVNAPRQCCILKESREK